MAFEQARARIDGVHVLEIPSDTDPIQAVEDACLLLEYAEMHTGMFSRKQLKALEYARDFAGRSIKDLE